MSFPDHARRQDRLNWLAEIYCAYAADLQRFICNKVGDPMLAEDLTSIIFLKSLRWLKEDESLQSVHSWLYTTARTTIIDHWQAQNLYEIRSLSGLEELHLLSDDGVHAEQQVEMRVQHLLDLLPERDRTILTMRYLQGYSAAEIAEALGTNAGHIRVLQLRALRRAAQVEATERNRHMTQEQESPFNTFIPLLAPESQQVLERAREEMLNLKHWWIGTEHLLWGLASEGSLTSFLAPLGITPERIHAGILFIFDRQAQKELLTQTVPSNTNVPSNASQLLTSRARQVIVLAGEEMKSRGEHSIRPTHLLLGLMNEGEGIGAGLLRSLGISLLQARTALAPPANDKSCSFCGRSGSQVAHFFPAEVGIAQEGGASSHSCICDHCVKRFHSMLETA